MPIAIVMAAAAESGTPQDWRPSRARKRFAEKKAVRRKADLEHPYQLDPQTPSAADS